MTSDIKQSDDLKKRLWIFVVHLNLLITSEASLLSDYIQHMVRRSDDLREI